VELIIRQEIYVPLGVNHYSQENYIFLTGFLSEATENHSRQGLV
jgi:hypothetical protein